MRIVFDVDDTIATGGHPYSECKPIEFVVDFVRKLKKAGHTIIFCTARYMALYDGDQEKATKHGKQELIFWLRKHNIPFDEIHLGKPSGDVYVDDKGWRVNSDTREGWAELLERIFK